MKKVISILSLSLIVSFTLMSGNVFAYKESDLKQLRYTGECSSCDLSDANLWNMNLSKSNLSGANLSGANLTNANLSGSNLTGAYLYKANLTGTNLTGANLKDVIKIRDEKFEKGNDNAKKEEEQKRKNLEEKELALKKEAKEKRAKDPSYTLSKEQKRKNLEQKKRESSGKKPSTPLKQKQKQKEKEKLLGSMYSQYILLKECYNTRKGEQFVWIKKTEMDLIRSYIKKVESKMIEDSPHLKSSKDKIWKDTSIETTIFVKNLKLYGYTDGKKLCDDMRDTFILIIDQMIPPTGEVVEKDF
jgi:uncharacterized protein YjbI with pentapeptide repeats